MFCNSNLIFIHSRGKVSKMLKSTLNEYLTALAITRNRTIFVICSRDIDKWSHKYIKKKTHNVGLKKRNILANSILHFILVLQKYQLRSRFWNQSVQFIHFTMQRIEHARFQLTGILLSFSIIKITFKLKRQFPEEWN